MWYVWMGFKEFLVGAGRRCCMTMEGRVPVVIFFYKTFGVKQYDGTMDNFVQQYDGTTEHVLRVGDVEVCDIGEDVEEFNGARRGFPLYNSREHCTC